MSHGASGTSLSEYDTKHFSRFLQLDIYRKRFEALKVLEKCKKHFFGFKIRPICLQICPGHRAAKIARDIGT